jgi:hypothetical protein
MVLAFVNPIEILKSFDSLIKQAKLKKGKSMKRKQGHNPEER